MPVRCRGCGLESKLDETMTWVATSDEGASPYCPACCADYRARRKAVFLGFFVLAGVVGLVVIGAALPGNFGWFMLGVSLFYCFQVVSVVPHELAHALAARVLRMRVSRIVIGSFGPIVARFRLLGVRLEIRAVPLGGCILAWPRGPFLARVRDFLVVLAGPLSHALLIGGAMAASTQLPHDSILMWMTGLFILSNLVQMVVNLWPRWVWSVEGVSPNDGLLLLRILLRRGPNASELGAARFAMEALECRERRDLDGAMRWIEQGLAQYPDSKALQCVLGVLLLERGDFQQARDIFRGLAAGESDLAAETGYISQVAWADLLAGDNLDEADRLSDEAYQRYPWAPEVAGIRGAVLAEQGRFREAQSMLRRGLRECDDPVVRAMLLAYLALAAAGEGKASESWRNLEDARRADPSCPVLDRVAARIRPFQPVLPSESQIPSPCATSDDDWTWRTSRNTRVVSHALTKGA